jgi:hypothetical protein
MHRKAAAATRRKHGDFLLVAYVWAYQGRGALHIHVLLGGTTPRERAAAEEYARQIDKRTAEHFFGFTKLGAKMAGEHHKFLDGLRAQGYLAKYVTKDGNAGRPEVLETAAAPDAPERIAYVRAGLSPWTMLALRRKRYAHRLLEVHGCEGLAGHGGFRMTPDKLEGLIARLLELDQPPPAAARM